MLLLLVLLLLVSPFSMADTVQNYLIDSLRQNDGYYCNVINANHPNPCGICQKNVSTNQKSLFCTSCSHKVHIKCDGTMLTVYNDMKQHSISMNGSETHPIKWNCRNCEITNRAKIFPFGLEDNYELANIVNSDSMEILSKLPSFEIASKACDIDSIKKIDIDVCKP